MKKQKSAEQVAEEQIPVVAESVATEKAPKKKKKAESSVKGAKEIPDTEIDAQKAETKVEKTKKVKEKEQKAAKEDKVTKFLVSMKKSLRKSVKKQAAEVGVSMNEYIVTAVELKLTQDGLNG
jgi:predicted HicB family RNase H-like nuclease